MSYKILYNPTVDQPVDQFQQTQPHPMEQLRQQAMDMQMQPQQQKKVSILDVPEPDMSNEPTDGTFFDSIGSTIRATARTAAAIPTRIAEGFVSEAGNTANLVGDITSLAGSPTYQDLQNESPISLPTSSQSREFVDKVTGNLLKPQGNIEETIQNIASDIGGYLPWLFLGPVGGALGGLKKAVKVAAGSNLLSQGVKMAGGSETAQALAKIGGGLTLGLRGTRKAAQGLHDVSYAKAAQNLPKNAVIDATNLEKNIDRVASEATKYNIKGAKDVNAEAKTIKDLIQEHPNINKDNLSKVRKSISNKISSDKISLDSKPIANEFIEDINKLTSNEKLTAAQARDFTNKWRGKLKEGDIPYALKDELNAAFKSVGTKKVIPVWDAWGVKKAINEKMYKTDSVKGGARKYYGEMVGSLNEDALNAYGKINNSFGKHFAIAEDLHKGLTEASKITQFFAKHASLENFVKKSPLLKAILGLHAYHSGLSPQMLAGLGLGGGVMVGGRELSRFKDLLSNSKEARRLWVNILKGAAQNNLALVTSSLERLDNISSQTNQ